MESREQVAGIRTWMEERLESHTASNVTKLFELLEFGLKVTLNPDPKLRGPRVEITDTATGFTESFLLDSYSGLARGIANAGGIVGREVDSADQEDVKRAILGGHIPQDDSVRYLMADHRLAVCLAQVVAGRSDIDATRPSGKGSRLQSALEEVRRVEGASTT